MQPSSGSLQTQWYVIQLTAVSSRESFLEAVKAVEQEAGRAPTTLTLHPKATLPSFLEDAAQAAGLTVLRRPYVLKWEGWLGFGEDDA